MKYNGISQVGWHGGQFLCPKLADGFIRVTLIDFASARLDLEHQQGTPEHSDLTVVESLLWCYHIPLDVLEKFWEPPSELEH